MSMNDYNWNLDCISHGTAHLSKNWTEEDQRKYNAWYYETHKGMYDDSANELTKAKAAREAGDEEEHDKHFERAQNISKRTEQVRNSPVTKVRYGAYRVGEMSADLVNKGADAIDNMFPKG